MKKPLLYSIIAYILTTNVYAIETKLLLNVVDNFCCTNYPEWSSSFSGYHVGEDYTIDTNTSLESLSFGKIKYRNDIAETCTGNTCSGQPDHGMGRILEIEYLLTNGERVTASYNHLNSFSSNSVVNKFVTSHQIVAKSGASGQNSNDYYSQPHLHFEMKSAPRNGEVIAPWGYSGGDCSNYSGNVCPSHRPEGFPSEHGYLNPDNYLNNVNGSF